MAKGNPIPEKLFIGRRKTATVKDEINNVDFFGQYAFAVDESNDKRKETVTEWSTYTDYDYTTKQYTKHVGQTLVRDNIPVELRIVNWQSRMSTDVMKVADEYNDIYDIRVYMLPEILKDCGIDRGGKFTGKFVWAMYDRSWTLIPYEGEIYKSLYVNHTLQTVGKKVDKFVPGEIYSNTRENSLYVGKFKYTGYDYKQHIIDLRWLNGQNPTLVLSSNYALPGWRNISYGFNGAKIGVKDIIDALKANSSNFDFFFTTTGGGYGDIEKTWDVTEINEFQDYIEKLLATNNGGHPHITFYTVKKEKPVDKDVFISIWDDEKEIDPNTKVEDYHIEYKDVKPPSKSLRVNYDIKGDKLKLVKDFKAAIIGTPKNINMYSFHSLKEII